MTFLLAMIKSKGNKYVSLGSTNDSFLYIINSLTYYSAKSTVNMGIETHTYPEKKREYLKLNDKTYKILSVDSSKITLEKIKQSTEIHTAFEPLIWLPNLAFNSIKNEPYNLEDFRGKDKFVLISVWASWCSPCIESMPFLDNIERRFKDKLQIISLNCKDDNPDFVKYTTNANILYGKITENDYKRLNGFGFPFYILFNSKGELISYHDTIKNYNWITSKIK